MGVTQPRDTSAPRTPGGAADALWIAMDVLLERATVQGMLVHQLGPLAAARMRRLEKPVPEALRAEERAALLGMRTGAALVERIRDAYDGPFVLLKGPEVASLYPSRARRFSDIDLLTSDALAVYRQLLENGFIPAPDERGTPEQHHHLEELRWPTISLRVEVHSTPNWLPSMRPPLVEEIFEAAVPTSLAIDGVTAPHPLHHTLILVSHAWRDEPLRTLRDLVDIAAMAALVDQRDLDRTAAAWNMGRVWQSTWRAIEHLLYDGPASIPLRSWARHLEEVRERSVLEHHLVRWLSPYAELPLWRAVSRMVRVAREEIQPAAGESWRGKLGRITSALRKPGAPVVRGGGVRPTARPAKREDKDTVA
jgi:hypothetical protein